MQLNSYQEKVRNSYQEVLMEKLTQKEQTQIQETEKYGLEFINDE